MTNLEVLRSYGVFPQLGGNGKLIVAGLASLTEDQAAKVEELARANKAVLVAELHEEHEKQRHRCHRCHPTESESLLPLTQYECREVQGWPVEVQRKFVRQLDAFEAQGHPLPQAEAMAYGAVKQEVVASCEIEAPWRCWWCGEKTFFF